MWASLLTSSLCQPPLCPAISHIAEMSRYSRSDARSPKDLLTRDAYIYGRARQKNLHHNYQVEGLVALYRAAEHASYRGQDALKSSGFTLLRQVSVIS
jgi:hypothetical protein